MNPVQRVMAILELSSKAQLARLCGVTRTCPREWERRCGGRIPSKHWPVLMADAKSKGKKLKLEDVAG